VCVCIYGVNVPLSRLGVSVRFPPGAAFFLILVDSRHVQLVDLGSKSAAADHGKDVQD
jgi:hypothetical protein